VNCCGHNQSTGRLFSFMARRLGKRYRKKGFTDTQRQMVEGLRREGFQGASLLEIGSGVGFLHQSLLREGAGQATGVDLAPKMLKEARRFAAEAGLSERTRYIDGDFVALADDIEAADITILDKVICCYPDADGLVHKSLAHTNRAIALTYPRVRLMTRIGSMLTAVMMWMIRSDYRNYLHDPEQVQAWIEEAGFRKDYENQNTVWLTQVYARP
jgi:2-polyprenyl-3-methyl-5-hydroxy-6-metoxy-1,4-benzoquinol methylase